MKVLKRLKLCAFSLLMSSYCLFAASWVPAEVILPKGTGLFHRTVPLLFRRSHTLLCKFTEGEDPASYAKNEQGFVPHAGRVPHRDSTNWKSREGSLQMSGSSLEDFWCLFRQIERKLNPSKNSLSGRNNPQTITKLERHSRRPAIITPVVHHEHSSGRDSLPKSMSKCAVDLQALPEVTSLPQSKELSQDSETKINRPSSVARMQDYLVKKIISAANTTQKINPQDVISILDLYAATAHRPKEGVVRVLDCRIDTPKSGIYNDIVAHVESRGLDLGIYRETYRKLDEAFGGRTTEFIYQAVAETLKEKKRFVYPLLKTASSQADYVSLIVTGADPLYPVYPNEVMAMLKLYAAFPDLPKERITNVLNYLAHTPPTPLYEYISGLGSNLDTYRNMFERVSRALDGRGMQIIYRVLDKKTRVDVHEERTNWSNQVSIPQSNQEMLGTLPPQDFNPHSDYAPRSELDGPDTVIAPMKLRANNPSVASLLNAESNDGPARSLSVESVEVSSGNKHPRVSGGEYSVSEKEKELLNRLYSLLPEYEARSITWVLTGRIKEIGDPVWLAVQNAVDRIQQEEKKKGNVTIMNLEYFRKIWESAGFPHPIGYRISETEKELLNRLYSLLPEYEARSITWVLTGKIKNTSDPVWLAVQNAVDRIQQEEKEKGNATVDLGVLRKLYYTLVKVDGNGWKA